MISSLVTQQKRQLTSTTFKTLSHMIRIYTVIWFSLSRLGMYLCQVLSTGDSKVNEIQV